RRGVRVEISPRIFPRRGAFSLRGVVDNDVGPFTVEHLEKTIVLKDDVNLMIGVARIAFAKIERKWLGLFGVSANANDPLSVGLFEEIEGGMHAKHAIPAQNYISLHNVSCLQS